MSRVTKPSRPTLGIDPGLARLGWAIVTQREGKPTLVGCGCIETAPHQPTPLRLRLLWRRLSDIIREYRPERMAIEKLYFTKNISTGIAVGEARGVALLAAAELDLPLIELTPTAIKLAVTGDGRADKRQVGKMIQLLLRLRRLPQHDDTTDAIAVALSGLTMKVIH